MCFEVFNFEQWETDQEQKVKIAPQNSQSKYTMRNLLGNHCIRFLEMGACYKDYSEQDGNAQVLKCAFFPDGCKDGNDITFNGTDA
jgi:hypothetical protein